LEFLPAKDAKLAQDWITARVGSGVTFTLFIVGIAFAAFLTWKRLDDERLNHIDAHTLADLTNILAESDELFNRLKPEGFDQYPAWEARWIADTDAWYQRTYTLLETKLSKADAYIIFSAYSSSGSPVS
jgi:hypothetical protein